MAPRVPVLIQNKDDIDELLAIKEEDCTTQLMTELFGEFNEKQRFHPYDNFYVPAGSYGPEGKKNKERCFTTVGLWVFNRFMIERELFDVFGYINHEINGDYWEDMMDKLSFAVIEDKITTKQLGYVLLKSQKLMPMCTILSPSISKKFLNLSDYIKPYKMELAKKYEKELAAGDAYVAEQMEKELITIALEYLKDDPALDLYLSKARSNINNHLKNMYIMGGAKRNPDPNADKQFNITLSCYNEGISKEEYPIFCNSLAAGPYSRAKKTEVGGYWEKLLVSAFQHVRLDPHGSDCGTTDTLEISLTKKNVKIWMYSYIVEKGNTLVELTSENMNKYIGTIVKFRFSSLCESKTGYCNKCMGERFYRLAVDKEKGVENLGVSMGMIASILKNKSMKAFHDSTVKNAIMDYKKAFGE